jgi:hypothetical protein
MRRFLRRHRVLLIVIALASYVVLYGSLYKLVSIGDRISEANCFRINRGMSEKQVEEILGPPDKDWGAGVKTWTSLNAGTIIVDFDAGGRVENAKFLSMINDRPELRRRWGADR